MHALVNIVAGAALLLVGRKLYWLFIAIAGFYVGVEVARALVVAQPQWVVWLAAAAAGVIGAIVVLSSMVGAALVVSSLGLGNLGSLLAYVGLAAVGIVVQAQLMRGAKATAASG